MNGNAYATIEKRDNKYYYCEYGKNPFHIYEGTELVWDSEGYRFKIS